MNANPDWAKPDYHAFVRRDIAPLLPPRAEQVLDVGCSQGGTLAWLRASGIAGRTTGIEIDPVAAQIARERVDCLIEGDVDAALGTLDSASFDLVLCLDVLEHLVDPWRTAARLGRMIRPGGTLIVSVPNVRHHSVALPLLWSGRWQYEDEGILDRTHLRFFTRASAAALLTGAGLEPAGHVDKGLEVTRRRDLWKPLLARTAWRDLGVFQFVISGRKPAAATAAASPTPAHASLAMGAAR